LRDGECDGAAQEILKHLIRRKNQETVDGSNPCEDRFIAEITTIQ